MLSAFGVDDSRLEIGKADRDTRRRVKQGVVGVGAIGAGVDARRAARPVTRAAWNARERAANARFDEGYTRGAQPLNQSALHGAIEDAERAEHSVHRLAGRAGGLRTAGALGIVGGTALAAHALHRKPRN